MQDRLKTLADYPDGLHEDVPSELYHQRVLGLVSKGALEEMDRSPLHYHAWATEAVDDEPTPSLIFGQHFHCALLEPDRFASEFIGAPDFGDCRFKENKAKRDAWRAENAGKTCVDADDFDAIRKMVDAVRSHPLAGRMINDGASELTALWRDPVSGLRCRARGDYYVARHGMLLDAKSTLDAGPKSFASDAFNYRYHWQAALYREGFAAAGADARHFVFIAVEKRAPHAVGVYTLDLNGIAIGARHVRRLRDRMAECLAKDEWPGYSNSIEELETPHWAA